MHRVSMRSAIRSTADGSAVMPGLAVDDCCENETASSTVLQEQLRCFENCKFEETRSGELVKPGRDEEFEVCVESACFKETYLLKAGNNWCVMLEGLAAGNTNTELDSCDYDVSYIVNQGAG